jgi:hypothetical protein
MHSSQHTARVARACLPTLGCPQLRKSEQGFFSKAEECVKMPPAWSGRLSIGLAPSLLPPADALPLNTQLTPPSSAPTPRLLPPRSSPHESRGCRAGCWVAPRVRSPRKRCSWDEDTRSPPAIMLRCSIAPHAPTLPSHPHPHIPYLAARSPILYPAHVSA